MNGLKKLARGLTTNTAVLEPSATEPELRPISLSTPVDAVAEQIEAWANQKTGWAVESSEKKDDGIHLHLTRTTRLFRFVDDIEVELSSENGGTRVDARSQSRVGKGDLGQNPRNLKELTQMLQAQRAT